MVASAARCPARLILTISSKTSIEFLALSYKETLAHCETVVAGSLSTEFTSYGVFMRRSISRYRIDGGEVAALCNAIAPSVFLDVIEDAFRLREMASRFFRITGKLQ